MKDNYAVTEYRIAKEVLSTFRRADPARPLRDRKLFNSCRETLREGGALIIWPEKNKVNFTEGRP